MTIHDLALRAAYDALAARGPVEGGGGFMRTVDETTFDSQRLALAQEAAAILRADVAPLDALALAELVEPRIRAVLAGGARR